MVSQQDKVRYNGTHYQSSTLNGQDNIKTTCMGEFVFGVGSTVYTNVIRRGLDTIIVLRNT